MVWLPRTWIQGSAALRRVWVRPIPPLAALLALVGLMAPEARAATNTAVLVAGEILMFKGAVHTGTIRTGMPDMVFKSVRYLDSGVDQILSGICACMVFDANDTVGPKNRKSMTLALSPSSTRQPSTTWSTSRQSLSSR